MSHQVCKDMLLRPSKAGRASRPCPSQSVRQTPDMPEIVYNARLFRFMRRAVSHCQLPAAGCWQISFVICLKVKVTVPFPVKVRVRVISRVGAEAVIAFAWVVTLIKFNMLQPFRNVVLPSIWQSGVQYLTFEFCIQFTHTKLGLLSTWLQL